jgi:hypothetical protein
MESDDFDLREWCRQQVRDSGLTQRQISNISGFTEKTISEMMNRKTGTIDSWQRVLNALPHVNRYQLPDVAVNVLRLCDYWDKMSKGESPTTKTIRMVIRRGINNG